MVLEHFVLEKDIRWDLHERGFELVSMISNNCGGNTEAGNLS